MKIHNQEFATSSPWSMKFRVKMLLWEYSWNILCRWTPKPLNKWRLFILKLYGAKIIGRPFVHQRARIQIPWNIELHHGAAIGDRANLYSLDKIIVKENATVAQEAYVCTGTHAFTFESMNLVTDRIIIGENVFIGARAFIMPGVNIEKNAIVGAMSHVFKDVLIGEIVSGNPAKFIKKREIVC